MKFIGRKLHTVLDFTVGFVLITAPWLFGFGMVSPAMWVAVIIGTVIIGMSLFTNYEGRPIKTIPMVIHLGIDVIAGLVLTTSPWVFGFSEEVHIPHLLIGGLIIGVGVSTVLEAPRKHQKQPIRQNELQGSH